MKTSRIITCLALLLVAVFYSCEKDEDQEPDNEDTIGQYDLKFENFEYGGNLQVVFTDGTTKSARMNKGRLGLPLNAEGNKTIKTIQLEGGQPILMGRKENENITLKFENSLLVHRAPVNGFIPIGTYAEFQLINSDKSTLSRDYELVADIDLMNEEWRPIGYGLADETYYFSFVFEGNGHELHNLKITNHEPGVLVGLFGESAFYTKSEIRNLTIRSGQISLNEPATFVGGIVGRGHKVLNCVSYCNISINSGQAGGIAGGAEEVINCHNYGNIKAINGGSLGGVIAYVYAQSINIKISDCSNHGDITVAASDDVVINVHSIGGIVGFVDMIDVPALNVISNCKNTGKIINNVAEPLYVGGIAGRASILLNCENSGAIISVDPDGNLSKGYAGGIAGYAENVQHSKNTGNVKGGYTAGGIAGAMVPYSESVSFNNANLGDVEGGLSAGGIAGEVGLTIKTSCNKGNITAKENVGGIVGRGYPDNRIYNSYNTGTITGVGSDLGFPTFVGGIISSSQNIPVLQNNYNIGEVYNNSSQDNSQSFGIGPAFGLAPPFNDYMGNFWKDYADDSATTAFSPSTHQDNSALEALALQFSATAWPQWPVSNDGWKSLGSWNNGNPLYPKLNFED